MQSLANLTLDNKATLLRLDLNVPLASRGEIRDDYKLRLAIPTIKAVLDKGARLAVAAHLGRPHGAMEERLSLANVGEVLANLLDIDVILAEDCIGDGVKGILRQLKPGAELLLLENLRFNAGEVANDELFAHDLAEPFDAYICDALSCSHRQHASLVNMAHRFKDKCLGPAAQAELKTIRKFFTSLDDESQLGVVVGGRSFAEKATLLQGMLDHAKVILIGGGVASTLLAAQGVEVGRSRIDKNMLKTANNFLHNAEARGVEVVLPVDHKMVKNYSALEPLAVSSSAAVAADSFGVDIGPSTVSLFAEKLAAMDAVLFCAPLGVSEWEKTGEGSLNLAQKIITMQKPAIFGGGELASQIKDLVLPARCLKSASGNALLTLLGAGDLPVLKQFADIQRNVLVS